MNSMFSLRNPVGVVGAMVAFVFSLSACGEDSGSNSGSDEHDSFLQVEVFEKLPNCSLNRDGVIAEVLENRKAYVCDDGRWELDHDILDSVKSADDLLVCMSKNEGDSVWAVKESAVFVCLDGKWEKLEKDVPESSSSATKKTASSSSKKDGGSKEQKSSSSKKDSESKEQKSSSSQKQEISSSSVKQKASSSSEALPSSSSSVEKLSSNSTAKSSSSKVTEPAGVSSSAVISGSSSVTPPMSSWSGGGAIGSMTDSRDGQTYKTVTIGTQTWMAQNLNYETAGSYCYSNNASNCTKYGRLYTWMNATSACPSGWHLPTKAEIETLFTAVGGQSVASKKLKSTSGWNNGGNGTDDYGFAALPAGYRDERENYIVEGDMAIFWSSTEYIYMEYISYDAYNMNFYYGDDNAGLINNYKDFAFSVRCLKDYSSAVILSSSSVTPPMSSSSVVRSSSSVIPPMYSSSAVISDVTGNLLTDSRDGQTYRIVTIGTQTWMAENLNYETENSYCYGDTPSNCTKYGRLYTWAAAKTACPTGWHLPTKDEFETLFTAVGGESKAGKKLKSKSGWGETFNGPGTDDYSFSALPAGARDYNGGYNSEGFTAFFWCSTEINSDYAYYMYLNFINDNAYLDSYYGKYYGYSVRCLKD